MKLKSDHFYLTHLYEIQKFISRTDEVLHVLNIESNFPNNEFFSNTIRISPNEDLTNNYEIKEYFYDLIVITDLFELTNDVYKFFNDIAKYIKPNGKLLVTSINSKWNLFLQIFEILGLKKKTPNRSYIHPKKINNIAKSTGFEVIYNHTRQIFPFYIFGLGKLFNKFLEFIFSKFNLGIKTYSLLRLEHFTQEKLTKSIIIPAKNEEGNLEELINRIPKFQEKTQIIIICGNSKDNTLQKSIEIKEKNKLSDITVLEQKSKGKSGAVLEAFECCEGEIIAILDSDISVDPETLTNFFEIIENGYCDFVNGTRLIYGKEKNSMRYLNSLGNLIFQFLISIVIKQKLTDSLCGTKVFKYKNINLVQNWRNQNLIKDPFGDFDLIFSAAYSGQKILEYPVHYRNRKYGKTQISRFKDGWKLLFYFIESFMKFNVSR